MNRFHESELAAVMLRSARLRSGTYWPGAALTMGKKSSATG